jgi:hypothetical protein
MNQLNFSIRNQLQEISNDFNLIKEGGSKTQDLVKFLTKLNDLNVQLVNESDNSLIIQIISYLSKTIPKNNSNLLFLFNSLVTYLTEKSVCIRNIFKKKILILTNKLQIIKLNKDDLNHQFSYFFDLFRSIPPTNASSKVDTLNTHDLFRCIGSLIYKNASNLTKNVSFKKKFI